MKITTKQELYDVLNNMNIEYDVTEHKPVYTIEEMNELGISHTTIEIEDKNDCCDEKECEVKINTEVHHHHHH